MNFIQAKSEDRRVPLEWISALITATIVAIVVIYRSVTRGLLVDESLFVHAIGLGLPDSLMASGSSHPPFMRFIVGAVLAPVSSPDWLLRLPSILCAVGSVFVWRRVLVRLIPDRWVVGFLLPAIALNPFWLQQAFQCLPYPALVFLSSVHCLAWMRFVDRPGIKSTAWLVVTGSLLPWIHFFGVNVLVAGQLIWLVLLWRGRVSLRNYIYTTLCTLVLTLPMVPLAAFYIINDGSSPLLQIENYSEYFFVISAYCFSKVTFPGFETSQPVYVILYLACGIHLWRHHLSPRWVWEKDDSVRLIAIGFLLAGFTASQLHCIILKGTMWPRYMMAGAWINLPVIAMLLMAFRQRRLTVAFTAICAAVAVGQLPLPDDSVSVGTDYTSIANYIHANREADDAFLVQAVDLWQDENHFDRLWLERYSGSDTKLRTVSGPLVSRFRLSEGGLPLACIAPDVQRIWVYSHLFKEKWLTKQEVEGWRLSDLRSFGGPFPLALFERDEESVGQRAVASKRSHGI